MVDSQLFNSESKITANSAEKKHTLYPTVTGTSVLGCSFKNGVILAADSLGSYGSLARFKNIQRIHKVNDSCVIAVSGDYSDFQFLKAEIDQLVRQERLINDGYQLSPKHVHSWLTRICYHHRSEFNPLWNTIVVGGVESRKPFLGLVNQLGIAFEAPSLASGLGAYMAQPMMRDSLEQKPASEMDRNDAIKLITNCMTVLYARDGRSTQKFDFVVCTEAGVEIVKDIKIKPDWSIAAAVQGYD